ncbi:DUF4943 family protein [Chitinophaga arvensicola]|uniref:DUF4943 domain-containing protein n=1 Tax=Chitinophaga arvensicola TaxID=29529 RepID=A0A1I0S971_9BACT|nr:DUF4943 family protein [Chitinophaga arvensicola]SEW52706.1 protein of unknown function [Chitinophaga arvensicola]
MKHLLVALSVVAVSFNACQRKADDGSAAAKKYVTQLKADKYPRYDIIPKLDTSAIPVLIQYVNDSSVIQNYPIPSLSAVAYGPQQVGMIIMYTIESIRLQRVNGASSIPYARDTTAPDRKLTVAELAPHYVDWWNKNKDKPAEELKVISPLAGTSLSWH